MVANLQDVCREVDAAMQKSGLRFKAGVTSEQHAEFAVLQHRHDGILIDVVLSVGEE